MAKWGFVIQGLWIAISLFVYFVYNDYKNMRTARKYIFVLISAILLSSFGSFAWKSVFAQQAPSGPKACSSNSDCSANQYCVGATQTQAGRCNVPPPIWNNNGISGFSPQNASFYIGGNGRIGNLLIGYGNQINNVASGEVAINYSSGATVGKGFTIYDGAVSPWFRVDNAGNVTVSNDLKVYGCFGPVFAGTTTNSYDGDQGGYKAVNSLCASKFLGSHVCSAQEILNSINCNMSPVAGLYWIQEGPPGFTADANDCGGWTTNDSGAFGRYWAFDVNGGQGWLQQCNAPVRQFACCK